MKSPIINLNTLRIQGAGMLPNIYDFNNVGRFDSQLAPLQDNEKGFDKYSREQVVRISRELFAQYPIFSVAAEQVANWTVGDGFKFKYIGVNPALKGPYEHYINNVWYNNCSIKGFNFRTVLTLLVQQRMVDGDILSILTKDKNNILKLQFATTDKITDKNGVTDSVTVNSIKYRYSDGILYADDGTPIFFAVKESEDSVKYLSVKNAYLFFKPAMIDKYRGLPALSAGSLHGKSLKELDKYLMDTLKLETIIAYQESNDTGEVPQEYANLLSNLGTTTNSEGAELPNTNLALERMQGSTIRYVKNGNEIKSFRSQRPSEEIQSYMRKIEMSLLSAIGYPHQLLYSPETINGRAVNAITEFVRKTVKTNQSLLIPHAKLFVACAIANAIENGDLEDTTESIPDVIDFKMCQEFTLDKKYDRDSDNEDYILGALPLKELIENNGGDYNETMELRKSETINFLTIVEDAHKQFPNYSREQILNLMTQRGQSSLSIQSTDTTTPAPSKEDTL